MSAAGAAPHSLELLGQFRSGGGGAEPFGFERTATLQFVDASAFHRRIEHLQGAAAGIDLVVMETAPLPGSAAGSSRCPARHCRLNGHRRVGSVAHRDDPFRYPDVAQDPRGRAGEASLFAEVSRPLTWLLFLVNRNNKSNIRFRNTPNVLLPIGCHGFPNLVSLSIIS